jgi:hypothetical protein
MACKNTVGRVFPNGICVTPDKRTNYKYNQDVPSLSAVALFRAKYNFIVL